MGVLKNDKQTIEPIIESIRNSSHPWAIDGLASLIINVLLQLISFDFYDLSTFY